MSPNLLLKGSCQGHRKKGLSIVLTPLGNEAVMKGSKMLITATLLELGIKNNLA